MPRFYITFGQKSPLRDGYVIIEADDEYTARMEAMYAFGGEKGWSRIYHEQAVADFDHSPDGYPIPGFFDHFKAGQFGKTIQLPSGYIHEAFPNPE